MPTGRKELIMNIETGIKGLSVKIGTDGVWRAKWS
jgi:hypothetical protein